MEKTKKFRRRRSDCSWRKGTKAKSIDSETIQYPDGPIKIACSWNPIDRMDKPPYSYATIIGHAILTSKERKLTLHDIYVWITDIYPFYSNDTQGWQNSIRHNLSLHKSFVKIDRDPTVQNPPRKGCFWTIRQGREKFFIDNLQKPVSSVKRQQSLGHFTACAGASSKRRHSLRRTVSNILSPSTSTTASSSPSRISCSFRTTNDVPESDQPSLSSPSSSSASGSSPTTYHQLFYNVPESTMSYHVYPAEQAEFFSNECYLNDNSSNSGNHPPLFSPCDTYSTSSAYNNNYQPLNSDSNRSSLYPLTFPTHKNHHSTFPLQHQPDPYMVEWSAVPNTTSADYFLQSTDE